MSISKRDSVFSEKHLRNLSDDRVQRVICRMIASSLDEIFDDYDFSLILSSDEDERIDGIYFNLGGKILLGT